MPTLSYSLFKMILVGGDVSLLTGLRAVVQLSSDSSDVGAETWVLVSFLFLRHPLTARFPSLEVPLISCDRQIVSVPSILCYYRTCRCLFPSPCPCLLLFTPSALAMSFVFCASEPRVPEGPCHCRVNVCHSHKMYPDVCTAHSVPVIPQ